MHFPFTFYEWTYSECTHHMRKPGLEQCSIEPENGYHRK